MSAPSRTILRRPICGLTVRSALDIGAAVHGTADRSIELLSLHPDVLRKDPAAPFALPVADRRVVFEDEKREYSGHLLDPVTAADLALVIAAIDSLKAKKAELAINRESDAVYTKDEKDHLNSLWKSVRYAYRNAYRKRLAVCLRDHAAIASSLSAPQIVDDFPEDGMSYAYDIEGVENVLSDVQIRHVGDIAESALGNDQGEAGEPTAQLVVTQQPGTSMVVADPVEATDTDDTAYSSLSAKRSACLLSKGGDWLEALEACVQLPRGAHAARSDRPRHAIINGLCPGICASPIAALIPERNRTSASSAACAAKADRELVHSHVNRCMAAKAMKDIEAHLLQEYAFEFERPPIKILGKNKSAMNLWKVAVNMHQQAKKLHRVQCQCGHTTFTHSAMRGHLLLAHQQ